LMIFQACSWDLVLCCWWYSRRAVEILFFVVDDIPGVQLRSCSLLLMIFQACSWDLVLCCWWYSRRAVEILFFVVDDIPGVQLRSCSLLLMIFQACSWDLVRRTPRQESVLATLSLGHTSAPFTSICGRDCGRRRRPGYHWKCRLNWRRWIRKFNSGLAHGFSATVIDDCKRQLNLEWPRSTWTGDDSIDMELGVNLREQHEPFNGLHIFLWWHSWPQCLSNDSMQDKNKWEDHVGGPGARGERSTEK